MNAGVGDRMKSAHYKLRVLICSRYELFRVGVKALLREQSLCEVVGEASTARAAIKQTQQLRPDVVLMGEATPEFSSAEATRRIRAIDSDVKVLVLSLNDDHVLISSCLEAGGSDYIRKHDD